MQHDVQAELPNVSPSPAEPIDVRPGRDRLLDRIGVHVGGGSDQVPAGPSGLWLALAERAAAPPPVAAGGRERTGPTHW